MNFSGTVQIYSKAYLELEDNSWNAIPTVGLLGKIHTSAAFGEPRHSMPAAAFSGGESARWIAVLGTPDGGVHRIALGDPIHELNGIPGVVTTNLYLPQWFCHQANIIGDGEDRRLTIHFERCEVLTKATNILFTPLGEIPEDIKIGELLEEPLSQLGVLQEGMIIPVPCFEGQISLRVKRCEPTQFVFLDGKEVQYDIEEERQSFIENRIPTPTPTPLTTPIFSSNSNGNEIFSSSMIPMLGSSTAFHVATVDQTSTVTRRGTRTSTLTTFISFGGIGRRLNEV